MSTILADLSAGRDNNLNLVRFLAASAVVLTHTLAMYDLETSDPGSKIFAVGSGDLAVNVFFVVSGFLISGSWLKRRNIVDFAWARAARIYPALWVSSLLFVLVFGLLFATTPLADFLQLPTTISYLTSNSTMLFGAQMGLPGLFAKADTSFNVPLWTLPHELQMYALVGLLGVAGLLDKKWVAVGIVCASLAIWVLGEKRLIDVDHSRFRLMCHFFLGVCCRLYAQRINLSGRTLAATLLVLGAVVAFVDMADRPFFLALATPILCLWLGFVPAGAIRKFNRLGDYSYGIYIFAFPIQLALANLAENLQGALANFAVSYTVVLLLAAASWHGLESRAIRAPQPSVLLHLKRGIDTYLPFLNRGLLSSGRG